MRPREIDLLRALRDRADDPLEFVVVNGVLVDLYDLGDAHAYLVAVRETLERKLGRAALLLGRAPRVSLVVPKSEADRVRTAVERAGIGLLSYRDGELKPEVQPKEWNVEPNVEIPTDRSRELATLLKSIADERRLTILRMLEHGEECLCAIAEALGESESSTSYHLSKLLEAGLVERKPEGGKSLYRLTDLGRLVIRTLKGLEERMKSRSRTGE
ncbi:MAG: ArsR/SmtB family transcription factor [Methanopyraceae archaeon]